MPLTSIQQAVIAVIAANRSQESHFAGGLVLNATDDSARFSHDCDIFHEAASALTRASEDDVAALRGAGFTVTPAAGDWTKDVDFRKAMVTRGGELVEIDWAVDSAFRFFPIERDTVLGWRLHLFDMATNKALAVAARSVTRDYVDIVELGRIYPLAAIVWAACGKDPGYGPLALLAMMRRFARINPAKLQEIQARKLDPVALKMEWTDQFAKAEQDIIHVADTMPELPIGIAFVDAAGKPGWIGDDPGLTLHPPSVRGCLPRIAGLELDLPKPNPSEA